MQVLETEFIAVAISAAPHAGGLFQGEDPQFRQLTAARVAKAFDALANVSDVSASRVEIDGSGRFDSVLYGKRTGGTVIAYSFTGLASDIVVPLFSAAIAFFTKSLGSGSLSDAAKVAIALWTNLSVLRHPGRRRCH